MKLSKIGFGTFRCYPDHDYHRRALKKSIKNGINVIDTASIYNFGEAERLVGEITQEVFRETKLKRNDLFIISKFGYIPKSDLQIHEKDGTITQDYFQSNHEMINLELLGINDTLYSLEPPLFEQQLSYSLENLQTDYLDLLMIHNPEHYIDFLDYEKNLNKGEERSPSLEDKLLDLFTYFENEVAKGTIKSYGISCNWLSYPSESQKISYQQWPIIAAKAYEKVHGKKSNDQLLSSFKFIQMPGNLLETYGINNTSVWAKQNGLNVLVNRPLDAIDHNGQWRLASYPPLPTSKYMEIYENTLQSLEPIGDDKNKIFLSTLIKDMERERSTYESIYHYQHDLNSQIIPMLHERLNMMRDPNILVSFQVFLNAYEAKVREKASLITESYIESNPAYKGLYSSRKTPLHKFALQYLVNNKNIDCVLNGMLKEEYVDNALEILREYNSKN